MPWCTVLALHPTLSFMFILTVSYGLSYSQIVDTNPIHFLQTVEGEEPPFPWSNLRSMLLIPHH